MVTAFKKKTKLQHLFCESAAAKQLYLGRQRNCNIVSEERKIFFSAGINRNYFIYLFNFIICSAHGKTYFNTTVHLNSYSPWLGRSSKKKNQHNTVIYIHLQLIGMRTENLREKYLKNLDKLTSFHGLTPIEVKRKGFWIKIQQAVYKYNVVWMIIKTDGRSLRNFSEES